VELKFHYCVYTTGLRNESVDSSPYSYSLFFNIHFNILSYLYIGLTNQFLTTISYVFVICTCMLHVLSISFLVLITLMISDEQKNVKLPHYCNFIYPPVTFSVLGHTQYSPLCFSFRLRSSFSLT